MRPVGEDGLTRELKRSYIGVTTAPVRGRKRARKGSLMAYFCKALYIIHLHKNKAAQRAAGWE